MGNGRSKHAGKYPAGVSLVGKTKAERIRNLRVSVEKLGYNLTNADVTIGKHMNALTLYADRLSKYQQAMGETDEVIKGASGNLSIAKLSDAYGDSDYLGNVRLSSVYMNETTRLITTLPHEHTHNLVHYLITKELGHSKDSLEYIQAYMDAVIERSINTNALNNYKIAEIKRIDLEISKTTDARSIGLLKLQRDNINSISTPYEAAAFTGMRTYATRDYGFAPKGAGIEIPTVASEEFSAVGYNWSRLKESSPYSYYVLKELKRRLK